MKRNMVGCIYIWKVLYKDCSFLLHPLTNMATTGKSCFWLVNFFKSSPLKPLGQMNRNFIVSIFGRSSIIKFAHVIEIQTFLCYSQNHPTATWSWKMTMFVCFLMVLNSTFNNISVILWRSVLLVEETGGPGENQWHRPVARNTCQNAPTTKTPHFLPKRPHFLPKRLHFLLPKCNHH